MNAKDLIEKLSEFPPETEVFFRRIPPICGNINSVDVVLDDTYGFFGVTHPCIILDEDQGDEDEEDEEGVDE